MNNQEKINEKLKYLEEESLFRQSMGEGNYAISFSDQVLKEIIDWASETEEQREEKRKRKYNIIQRNIRECIANNKEIIFVTGQPLFEHFLSNGRFNASAYYNLAYPNKQVSFDEFCQTDLSSMIDCLNKRATVYISINDSCQTYGLSLLWIFNLIKKENTGNQETISTRLSTSVDDLPITTEDIAQSLNDWIKEYLNINRGIKIKYGSIRDETLIDYERLSNYYKRKGEIPISLEEGIKQIEKDREKYKLDGLPYGKFFNF